MADILYPFSLEEAKREGRVDDWKESRCLNVKCARDIENLITAHAQKGQLEPDCARAALDWWGFHRVQFVLANTLSHASADGFDGDSFHWARAVFVPHDKNNGDFTVKADKPPVREYWQVALISAVS